MPEPEGTPAPVAIVDSSGKFSETWRDSLPEDIRGDESLKVVTDFPGLVRQHINAQKMIGKDKVVVPGPNASDAERDAFFTAIGRPKTAGDYKVEIPPDLKGIFDPARLDKARAIAHKLGVTQAQFEGYMKAEAEAATELLAGEDKATEAAKQSANDELRRRFGGAYDERMHVANRLVSEICPEPSKQFNMLQKFGNDPDFIEFVSDCGAKLVEHKALIAEITRATPKEAESKMAELRATPGYLMVDKTTGKLLKDTDPAKHKAITDEITKLVKETYPAARPARTGL